MAILGIGVDIVKIDRIRKLVCKQPKRFPERILTATELQVYEQHKQATRYLAKRFAAKEAASKALGTGIGKGISFHDFDTINLESGQPTFIISDRLQTSLNTHGSVKLHLSLSDEDDYAIAYVLLESLTTN